MNTLISSVLTYTARLNFKQMVGRGQRAHNGMVETVEASSSGHVPMARPAAIVSMEPIQVKDKTLKLPRRFDATCYEEVLRVVRQIDSHGDAELVLDLIDVEQLAVSGIFTLHCIGLMMRGETPPDGAYGWHAFRTAAARNLAAGRLERLKLVNPSARVEALLRANHFDRCVIIESQS